MLAGERLANESGLNRPFRCPIDQTQRSDEVPAAAVTLNVYAEAFDKPMHREDLMQRTEKAGFDVV